MQNPDIPSVYIKEECRPPDVWNMWDMTQLRFVESSVCFKDSKVQEPIRIFYDVSSKTYFNSTLANVMEAEYQLNRNYVLCGGLTMDNWYALLGISPPEDSFDKAWGFEDNVWWIDFKHKLRILDDDRECIDIEIVFEAEVFDAND